MINPKIKGYSADGKPIITVCYMCGLTETEKGWEKYEKSEKAESHGLCNNCISTCKKRI